MSILRLRKAGVAGIIGAGLALLASCAAPPPPPPPPPPPQITPRPYPPLGAAPNLAIPPMGVDGVRRTINSGLTSQQAVWNLRSAYNVAALNCLDPEHADIVGSYGDFLTTHRKSLTDVNSGLDASFREQYGRKDYVAQREVYQTSVYNYFALPPTMPVFCDAALVMAQELKTVPAGQLEAYAPNALAQIESVFQQFFTDYQNYERNFVTWQQDYISKYNTVPAAGYFLPGERRYDPNAARIELPQGPAQPETGTVVPSDGLGVEPATTPTTD